MERLHFLVDFGTSQELEEVAYKSKIWGFLAENVQKSLIMALPDAGTAGRVATQA